MFVKVKVGCVFRFFEWSGNSKICKSKKHANEEFSISETSPDYLDQKNKVEIIEGISLVEPKKVEKVEPEKVDKKESKKKKEKSSKKSSKAGVNGSNDNNKSEKVLSNSRK